MQQRIKCGNRLAAAENFCRALAAVENDPLGEHGKPADGRRTERSGQSVADDAVVEGQIDRVIAPLVGEGFQLDIGEQELGAAGLGAGRGIERSLRRSGQIDTEILNAVLIKT